MRIETEAIGVTNIVAHTCGMFLKRVQGISGVDGFLQLHDAKKLPANTSVPLRTWPVYAGVGFDTNFQNDDIQLLVGCVFALSSTQATLTISASTMDIYVNGESAWDNSGVQTPAGDYTTGRETLQVWAQDVAAAVLTSKYKLLRVEVKDTGTSGAVFVQIHAADTPATDKIVHSAPLATGSFVDLQFGDGLSIQKRSAQPANLMYNGCTVAISTTQNTYTAAGANNWVIKANYKNI